MPRTPSIQEVGQLDRDAWETVCTSLCALLFGAHRVEDRQGRGNGLDAWRRPGGGVYGWQFRRFDGRLGSTQAANIRKNLRAAATWASPELGLPLRRFTMVFNIDPEPTHVGAPGEIARLAEIAKWAKDELNVSFTWRGVSWVRAHLLSHPQLCPSLFEDLAASIEGAERRLTDGLDSIQAQLNALLGQSSAHAAFATLIREASLHYERGDKFQEAEELRRSVTSLEDALRLIDSHAEHIAGGRHLLGRVLTLLCGVVATSGRFASAIEYGRRAVEVTNGINDKLLQLYSHGNLAAAFSRAGQPREAKPLFEQVLSTAEELGNVVEIIRTRTYLLEVDAALQDDEALLVGIVDLKQILARFHSLHEPLPITVAAWGQCATAMLELSRHAPDLLREALAVFWAVEQMAAGTNKDLVLASRSQRARCHWLLGDLTKAAELFASVEGAAIDEYPGRSADACFNLAFVIRDAGREQEALATMQRARDRYAELGSAADVDNADRELQRMSGEG